MLGSVLQVREIRGRAIGEPKKLPGANRPIRHTLNLKRQLPRALVAARNDAVDLVVGTAAKGPLKRPNRRNATPEVHTLKVYPKAGEATPKSVIPKTGTVPDAFRMGDVAEWPQRERFRTLLDSYQERTGETHAQVAKRLGISLATLRNCIYAVKRPGIKVLRKASELFGCSMDELAGGISQPPGVAASDWGKVSVAKRAAFKAMFQTLKDVPDDELTEYLRLLKQGREIGKARKGGN